MNCVTAAGLPRLFHRTTSRASGQPVGLSGCVKPWSEMSRAAWVSSEANRSTASYGKRWLGPLSESEAMTVPERPTTPYVHAWT
ncbi:hypothetical protein H1V43_17065 [Streptomyces sp. PSKA54]|uniref:Uncharacterized protein n=1 Tax=Streptomyces himalayensis subsp. aureolus TaxID=2758039 RepID=A0A7W2D1J4_9ACTN|nr:hypothetical protein [Streptomyces himalayensis]MBA4863060.1 hypothetical protein [Streptomyces himalayensis subsp. aureolus]